MRAIFKREFKSYFQTVIGWLFIAVTLGLFGLYFFYVNITQGSSSLADSLSSILFIFMITVPILTMKVFAEEKHSKTDQMILTSPVSIGKIVVGKYAAMAAIFTIPVLVMCLCPPIMSAFGDVAFPENYVAILGLWFYGLLCIAIGMLISSLTESQVIAAVLTFVFLFIGYMMSSITYLISTSGNLLTKVLNAYNLTDKLNHFFSGCLDVTGIVYYLTMILLFLFLTTQSIQKRRFTITKKSWKYGAFGTGSVVIAIAAVVILNLGVEELPTSATSIDLTSNKMYSITSTTKKMLKKLDSDVTIYVLSSENDHDSAVEMTLNKYKSASSHIKIKYVDPAVSPNFASKYTDSSLSQNSLIVVGDSGNRTIDYNSLYQYDTDYSTGSYTVTGYDAEGQVTSAIQYVTSDNKEKIYLIKGQDEGSLDTGFSDALSKANIETEEINLLNYDAIPEDAQAILIFAPTSDFSKEDAKKVTDYLSAGGNAMIIATYTDKEMPNFESILSAYQISIEKGLVAEGSSTGYYQNPFYLLPTVGYDTITSDLSEDYILAPYAVGLTYQSDQLPDTMDISELLTTSDKSYSKTDVQNMTSYEKEAGDTDGPFYIGLRVVNTIDDTTATNLVVFSSETMFTDDADAVVSGHNLQLFKNGIGSLTDAESTSTSVAVKSVDAATLTVSTATSLLFAIFGIVVIPLSLLGIGILIWANRRKK